MTTDADLPALPEDDYHLDTVYTAADLDNAVRAAITADLERAGSVDARVAHPAPSMAAPEGCACRWDADDKRVQTCERHQGWLDVIAEWADRARAAEAALAASPQPHTQQEGSCAT